MSEPDSKTVVKQVRLMIDNRDEKAYPLIEDWMAAVKEALAPLGHITLTGENYLILDRKAGTGKVCRVDDYDPETRDFKEGASPPAWAGGPVGPPGIPMKGAHRLDAEGNKIPIETAPAPFVPGGPLPRSKKKSKERPRSVPTTVEPEEDELDLDSDELFKSAESEAESVATSSADAAAKRFKLKKKG